MDVTNIPFAKHIGIKRKEEGVLKLESTETVQNHIQTIHASAQFALAETQSGLHLQKIFPTLENKVVGLLRSSNVKYKNPATQTLYAYATVDELEKDKFISQLERKGRASITVSVEVRDVNELLTMQGEFTWFVQLRENM